MTPSARRRKYASAADHLSRAVGQLFDVHESLRDNGYRLSVAERDEWSELVSALTTAERARKCLPGAGA
jgi:hypothetical protein